MDIEKSNEQLWHRLENEPRRAFEAFQTYLSLPSGSRTIVEAYRRHVDNPHATRVSDTWTGWSRDFAWTLRATAYDDYLESLRREAYERAVGEEAERQALEVEKMRGRFHELLTVTVERTLEFVESEDFLSQLRTQDVIGLLKLYGEVIEKQGGFNPPQEIADLSEDELAEFHRTLEEIEAEEGSDGGEEGSEYSEGDSE